MRNSLWLVGSVLAVISLQAARGATIPLPGNAVLEVDQSIGSGPDQAYLVVDFGNNGGGSYAFEYRFDAAQNVSAQSAWLQLIDETELNWTVQNFGSDQEPNLFITGLIYHGEGETPDYNTSQQSWVYWTGVWDALDSELDWTASQLGMRDRVLNAGAFDGWRVSAYDPVTFEPLTAPAAPISIVPEPGISLWVIIGACGVWIGRRRVCPTRGADARHS